MLSLKPEARAADLLRGAMVLAWAIAGAPSIDLLLLELFKGSCGADWLPTEDDISWGEHMTPTRPLRNPRCGLRISLVAQDIECDLFNCAT